MGNKRKKHVEGQNFWQSYSDMMAALLLVFILIIAVVISREKAIYEAKQQEVDEFQQQVEEQRKELEEQKGQLENQQQQLEEQQQQLDAIVGIRQEIIKKLVAEFKENDTTIKIDAETGAITFDSNILFDKNKAALKAEGIDFLNQFFPKYFSVIMSEGVREYISEVIFEGHTDSTGGYLLNLDLSQRRAFAVAEYCLGDNNTMFTVEERKQIRQIVTATGRAYYGLIYNEDGTENMAASRRVEIKFRLTEEEMIKNIIGIIGEGK